MIPNILYRRFALFSIVGLFLLVGCVNDDLSVCGFNVHFKYTRNTTHTDRFAKEITKVNLYIFDADSTSTDYEKLVDEYTIEQNPMPEDLTIYLNLIPGHYEFVAWGNLKGSYELTEPAVKGITTKSDLEIQLIRGVGATTINELPSNLYYGSLEQVKVTPHDLLIQKDIVIDLIKNTKEITVIAHGLAIMTESRAAGTAYDCGLSSLDGNLNFDNYTIGDETLQYIPDASVEEDSLLVSRFSIVRDHADVKDHAGILKYRSPQSRVKIERSDPNGIPFRTLLDRDLYPILVAAAENDPLLLSNGIDSKVDIKDKYQIDIYFDETFGTATIVVEGWTINESDVPVYGGGKY
jgi:hypothetical protein